MDQKEIYKRLKEPFNYNEIEWRILNTSQDKSRGLAVAFLDARAVQKRLDDTVGIFNWRNEYSIWQDKAQLCSISIYCEDRKEWITKYDGAENSDIEAIKGGLSDAFKRTAVLFGVGRYLYDLGSIWVDVEARGKSYSIKQDQYNKLETEYNKAVARIFGDTAKKQTDMSSCSASKQSMPKQQSAINESISIDNYHYKVQSVKPSGKSSQLLELVNNDGEIISAYIKKSNESISAGIHLKKVNITQKASNYGPYNLIDYYEIAA